MKRGAALLGLLALTAACSARGGPERSLVFHGVTVTTAMPGVLTVIGEQVDDAGTRHLLGYGVLGDSAGQQSVGGALANGTRLHLRFGVDAELWQQDGTAPPQLVQGKALHGLAGANVDHGTLELRAGSQTFEATVPPASHWRVELEADGRIGITEVH